MRCPACDHEITKPARELDGSSVIGQPPYVRLTPEGKIIVACPKCRAELRPTTERLVLWKRKEPTKSSAGSSA